MSAGNPDQKAYVYVAFSSLNHRNHGNDENHGSPGVQGPKNGLRSIHEMALDVSRVLA